MSKPIELETLLARFKDYDLERFTSEVIARPMLYIEQFLAASDPQGVATLKGDTSERRRVDMFFPLVKRPGSNVFASMITLGRAANNDVVIEGEGISKFHAYFVKQGEDWQVVDAGSTFGTFVDEERVEARNQRVTLSDKSALRFGNALMGRFLSPESCYSLVQSKRGSGSGTSLVP